MGNWKQTKRRQWGRKIFEETKAKNFPKLMTTYRRFKKFRKHPRRKKPKIKQTKLYHIIFKLLKTKEIFEGSQRERTHHSRGTKNSSTFFVGKYESNNKAMESFIFKGLKEKRKKNLPGAAV